MAKRLIDTDIFKKGFVKSLEAPYKLLWLYIINDCDHSGIWDVELDIAEIRLGVSFEVNPVDVFSDKIHVFDKGKKWFIPSFIEFQYGELNPKNRVHNSVLTNLNKNKIKGYISPLQGAKDKDIDKDKDKDKDITYSVLVLKEKYKKEKKVHEVICKRENINEELLFKKLDEFTDLLIAQNRQSEFWGEYTKYFNNWLPKNLKSSNSNDIFKIAL